MTKQEEKQWLRAILEGRVKPGDEAWSVFRIRSKQKYGY